MRRVVSVHERIWCRWHEAKLCDLALSNIAAHDSHGLIVDERGEGGATSQRREVAAHVVGRQFAELAGRVVN